MVLDHKEEVFYSKYIGRRKLNVIILPGFLPSIKLILPSKHSTDLMDNARKSCKSLLEHIVISQNLFIDNICVTGVAGEYQEAHHQSKDIFTSGNGDGYVITATGLSVCVLKTLRANLWTYFQVIARIDRQGTIRKIVWWVLNSYRNAGYFVGWVDVLMGV